LKGSILLGNTKSCKIIVFGIINSSFMMRLIDEIRFTHNFKINLIFFGELENKGFVFKGKNA